MVAFDPNKEIKAVYEDLKYKRKGCIKRAEKLFEYLSTQDQNLWKPVVAGIRREMRIAKREMDKKDY